MTVCSVYNYRGLGKETAPICGLSKPLSPCSKFNCCCTPCALHFPIYVAVADIFKYTFIIPILVTNTSCSDIQTFSFLARNNAKSLDKIRFFFALVTATYRTFTSSSSTLSITWNESIH